MKTISMNVVAPLAATLFVSLNAHACLTNETESNNTESQANTGVCSNTAISGDLNRRDIDWFQFDVKQAGDIAINLNHHSGDDFDWALYKETGPAVATGQTSNLPESGSYTASAAQTFFVKLTRYAGQGWYDLNITYPNDAEDDNNDNACGYGSAPPIPNNLTTYMTGNSADSCKSLVSGNGAALLMGGGSDVDTAFSQRVATHIGTNTDVVVLRTSGSDGYNTYLQGLMNADSVNTLMIDTRSKADSDYVDWAIRSAEFVFVAGGDQSDYLNQWAGTKVQLALQHVFDKGGVIGGTSAGMALMASSIYDPDGLLGAISEEVVTDFCHDTLNFAGGLFSIPALNSTLTDTHFTERDRMGRALVSLSQHSTSHRVIAADENASLFVTSNGSAVTDGSGSVYVFRETSSTQRQTLSCNTPVQYTDVQRIKLTNGQSINLNTFIHNGTVLNVSVDGYNNNFYSPTNPY